MLSWQAAEHQTVQFLIFIAYWYLSRIEKRINANEMSSNQFEFSSYIKMLGKFRILWWKKLFLRSSRTLTITKSHDVHIQVDDGLWSATEKLMANIVIWVYAWWTQCGDVGIPWGRTNNFFLVYFRFRSVLASDGNKTVIILSTFSNYSSIRQNRVFQRHPVSIRIFIFFPFAAELNPE